MLITELRILFFGLFLALGSEVKIHSANFMYYENPRCNIDFESPSCSLQNLTVHGLYWGSYKTFNPKVMQDSMQGLLEMLTNGSLRVHISHTFSLTEVCFAWIFDPLLSKFVT